ncbi:hypothetical protein HPB52_009681 [Rhipicephalus sanguineus]|uniref:Uncharacterized protein n=1 Tax=Rhipicephalus sanguineus TaxID=34632 RepID=A0A9D4T1M9_RHISA|nr:hypothetical protein HPB52_009681 [Rhipicephalus sanguineus]
MATRQFFLIADHTTEFLWNVTLAKLRAQKPKKQCSPGQQAVRTAGNITLPDYVQRVLSLGPKFAVEPRKTAPELLSMARCIGRAAPDSESVRCVSECVDVLCRRKPGANQLPVRHVQQFLRNSSLSVLPADKEGGFVVLTDGQGPCCLDQNQASPTRPELHRIILIMVALPLCFFLCC